MFSCNIENEIRKEISGFFIYCFARIKKVLIFFIIPNNYMNKNFYFGKQTQNYKIYSTFFLFFVFV